KFLWEHDYNALYSRTPKITGMNLPQPGEWDRDGSIFFAVYAYTGGNSWNSAIYFVYVLHRDGAVVSPLKNAVAPGYVILKLEERPFDNHNAMLWAYGPTCCDSGPIRYYTLIGDQLVNDWYIHIEEYMRAIGSAVYAVTTAKVATDEDAR